MPIDKLKIELNDDVPEIAKRSRDSFEYNNIIFVPVYGKSTGEINKFSGKIQNLMIDFFPSSNKYVITNSLHKFLHGWNQTDFTLSELNKSIENLSDMLHVNVFDGKIKNIEYGCNVIVSDVTSTWQDLKSYKGKRYVPQNFGGKDYGANCYFKQYTIKAYNKTAETKEHNSNKNTIVHNNLFRWEVAAKYMTALYNRKYPIPIEKVKDLVDITKLQYLVDDAVAKYNDSIKNSEPNINSLSLNKVTALARMNTPAYSQFIKENHPDTFNKDRATFNKIMKVTAMEKNIVGKLIEQKMRDLINS